MRLVKSRLRVVFYTTKTPRNLCLATNQTDFFRFAATRVFGLVIFDYARRGGPAWSHAESSAPLPRHDCAERSQQISSIWIMKVRRQRNKITERTRGHREAAASSV